MDLRTDIMRVRASFDEKLGDDERASIYAWGAYTATFASVRALTHWLRDGHGPSSGGISVGGQHFHHYNIGIGLLTVLGGGSVRPDRLRKHRVLAPVAFGVATALITDEAALLLDLKDVYWSRQGRLSVEAAGAVIGIGGLAIAAAPVLARMDHGA